MAKWDFKIVGASFVKETVGSDVQFRSQSFMSPSFHLEGGKIVMKESGNYVTAIYFSQIGEIDGVAPTDIDDAYAKLLALVENFNGGGATPPTFGQVLSQQDRVVKFTSEYTRTNDEILLENRLERLIFDANRLICNLNDSENLFPLYSSVPFVVGQSASITFTPISTDVRSNLGVDVNTPITSVTLNRGDNCLLVKTAEDPIWFLQVDRIGSGGTWGSITGTLSAQTDLQSALNAKQNITVATTGAVIAFSNPQVYNSIASPSSSNLTDNLTGARIGVVQKIYHNAGTAPTVPAGWVKRGTGSYVTSTLNIIYAEWSVGTTVEYWITQ